MTTPLSLAIFTAILAILTAISMIKQPFLNTSKWSKSAWAASGILISLAIGSKKPMSRLAGAAALCCLAFASRPRKQSVTTEVAPRNAPEPEKENTTAPVMWLETTPEVELIQSGAPHEAVSGSSPDFFTTSVFPPTPEIEVLRSLTIPAPVGLGTSPEIAESNVSSTKWHPGQELHIKNEAWGEPVCFTGEAFPLIPQSEQREITKEHRATDVLHFDFEHVWKPIEHTAAPAASLLLPQRLTQQEDSPENGVELVSYETVESVASAEFQPVETPHFMFLEEGATPIECDPEPVRLDLDQPLSPFGESAMDFLHAPPIHVDNNSEPQISWRQSSTTVYEGPEEPGDNWATLSPFESNLIIHDQAASPQEAMQGEGATDGEQASLFLPSQSKWTPQEERQADAFAKAPDEAPLNVESAAEIADDYLEVAHHTSEIVTPDSTGLWSPFTVCEPAAEATVTRVRGVLAQLIAPKQTTLMEPRSRDDARIPSESLPAGRRPVPLKKLVPLAPGS